MGSPAVAFLLSRYGRTRGIRYQIAATMMLAVLSLAIVITAVLASPKAALMIIPASMCCWVPQMMFLYAMHALWKSGLRSAGVNPDEFDNEAKGLE